MTAVTTQSLRILVVDDEAVVRDSLTQWFQEDGHEVRAASGGREALEAVRESTWDLALIDIKMPGMDGLELERRILEVAPDVTIIMMTAYASVKTAVRALKDGAFDYVTKPFDPDELSQALRRIAEKRRHLEEDRANKAKMTGASTPVILGSSDAIRGVVAQIDTVAPLPTTVLVTGESGTGKELVARSIHAQSPRAYMPLVTVNCGALPESILESELFGHERGAFTGAQYRHKGKFELADGGTLFLDEVGELAPKIQVELLRVLEEKQVVRVGGSEPVQADFRLIAATNKNLEAEMRAGRFREDLFYRLHVFNIHVPPLRERGDDVLILARAFASRVSLALDRVTPEISPEAAARLRAHSWPGNVRELANVIEQAVVAHPGTPIRPAHLQLGARDGSSDAVTGGDGDVPLALTDVERQHVERVLRDTNWNISQAARVLHVDRKTVYAKIKQFGLTKDG